MFMMVPTMEGLVARLQEFSAFDVLVALVGVIVVAWIMLSTTQKALLEGRIHAWLAGGRLPPGGMGIPYWGETLGYQKAWGGDSVSADSWYVQRRHRYGDVFKTHLFGSPTVVLLGPSANKFVLSNEDRLFVTSWPTSMRELEGPMAVSMVEGEAHRRLRRALRAFIGPEALRPFLPRLEAIVSEDLHKAWLPGTELNVFNSLRSIVFRMNAELIIGASPGSLVMATFEHHFKAFHQGLLSLPLNLPWTVFGKAKKARAALLGCIFQEINKRREEARTSQVGGYNKVTYDDPWREEEVKEKAPKDLLDLLLAYKEEGEEDGYGLEEMGDNLLLMVHAGQDTVVAGLTCILKRLTDNPSVLQQLRKECLKLAQEKKGDAMTWQDLKSMELMRHCIQEGLRMSSPVNIIFKKAKKDIVYNGYTIPKGWKVQLAMRQTHNQEEFYPNPEKFDPSRFKVRKGGFTYLPFGQGHRICPGIDFAFVSMQIILHHILINLQWEPVDPNEKIVALPFFSQPEKGLPIRIL